jgi:hypothetical protein
MARPRKKDSRAKKQAASRVPPADALEGLSLEDRVAPVDETQVAQIKKKASDEDNESEDEKQSGEASYSPNDFKLALRQASSDALGATLGGLGPPGAWISADDAQCDEIAVDMNERFQDSDKWILRVYDCDLVLKALIWGKRPEPLYGDANSFPADWKEQIKEEINLCSTELYEQNNTDSTRTHGRRAVGMSSQNTRTNGPT